MIPPTSTNPTTSNQLVTKSYADNLANQGAATSTEVIGGIAELATYAENASSTQWDTENPHIQQSEHATSTPSDGITAVNAGIWDVWSENDGKLNQLWIDLTEAFSWTGLHTFGAGFISNASSTQIGDFRIDGNATTTGTQAVSSLLFTADNTVMASRDDKLHYATSSDFLINSAAAETVIATTTLYNLSSDAIIKYRLFTEGQGGGSGENYMAIRLGNVTTTPWIDGGSVGYIYYEGTIQNVSNSSQIVFMSGREIDNSATTSMGLMSVDTSGAVSVNLYKTGVGTSPAILKGFSVEVLED